MQVKVLNTKTMEETHFQTIEHAKAKIIPLSAKTGYTFKVFNTNTGEIVGNIRPNPRQYKTRANPERKLTARFIRQD